MQTDNRGMQMIRISSKDCLNPLQDIKKFKNVQLTEFGSKNEPNQAAPNKRVSSAAQTKRQMVYSTINKNLKLELRRHVPMYDHNMMGKIFYRQTESMIVRPTTAGGTVYKSIKKHADSSRPLSSLQPARPGSVGPEIHLTPEHVPSRVLPATNASIRGKDNQRDLAIHQDLGFFLKCNGCSKKVDQPELQTSPATTGYDFEAPYATRTSQWEPTDQAMRTMQFKAPQRNGFTVLHNIKRHQLSLGNIRKVVPFEHSNHMLTLARVNN